MNYLSENRQKDMAGDGKKVSVVDAFLDALSAGVRPSMEVLEFMALAAKRENNNSIIPEGVISIRGDSVNESDGSGSGVTTMSRCARRHFRSKLRKEARTRSAELPGYSYLSLLNVYAVDQVKLDLGPSPTLDKVFHLPIDKYDLSVFSKRHLVRDSEACVYTVRVEAGSITAAQAVLALRACCSTFVSDALYNVMRKSYTVSPLCIVYPWVCGGSFSWEVHEELSLSDDSSQGSDSEDGHCYMLALQSQFPILGTWPTVDQFLSLSSRHLMPLTDVEKLGLDVSANGTCHVRTGGGGFVSKLSGISGLSKYPRGSIGAFIHDSYRVKLPTDVLPQMRIGGSSSREGGVMVGVPYSIPKFKGVAGVKSNVDIEWEVVPVTLVNANCNTSAFWLSGTVPLHAVVVLNVSGMFAVADYTDGVVCDGMLAVMRSGSYRLLVQGNKLSVSVQAIAVRSNAPEMAVTVLASMGEKPLWFHSSCMLPRNVRLAAVPPDGCGMSDGTLTQACALFGFRLSCLAVVKRELYKSAQSSGMRVVPGQSAQHVHDAEEVGGEVEAYDYSKLASAVKNSTFVLPFGQYLNDVAVVRALAQFPLQYLVQFSQSTLWTEMFNVVWDCGNEVLPCVIRVDMARATNRFNRFTDGLSGMLALGSTVLRIDVLHEDAELVTASVGSLKVGDVPDKSYEVAVKQPNKAYVRVSSTRVDLVVCRSSHVNAHVIAEILFNFMHTPVGVVFADE